MSRVDCKQVDIWAAALHTGELDEPSRIRLMEHLDHCPACRRRAEGITALVEMLQDEPARMPRHRVNAIWRDVEAAASEPAPAPRRTSRRRGLLLAAAGLAAALALALALGLGYLGQITLRPAPDRNAPVAPAPGLATAPAPAPVEDTPAPPNPAAPAEQQESRHWEISWINGQASTDGRSLSSGAVLAQGDRLQVGRKGRALLVGPSEVMVVGEETSLDLVGGKAGASRVRLVQGQITVLTRNRDKTDATPRERVEVAVGKLMVRPLGTIFSVHWSGGSGEPEIALAEGRLEVLSPSRTVTLEAPARLVWGSPPQRLTGEAGRKLVERLTSVQKRAARVRRPSSKRVASKPPAAGPQAPTMRSELRSLESMLLGGKAAQVRARAMELLGEPGAMEKREAPALLGLMAESYVRQGRYAEARKAYLRTWKQFPHALYGMDSLYSAASMELQQLGKPNQARRHLATYLSSYKEGRQREGAYYLLHRALTLQGKPNQAGEVAARYRKEFPSGQYRVLFK